MSLREKREADVLEFARDCARRQTHARSVHLEDCQFGSRVVTAPRTQTETLTPNPATLSGPPTLSRPEAYGPKSTAEGPARKQWPGKQRSPCWERSVPRLSDSENRSPYSYIAIYPILKVSIQFPISLSG